jgi:hypothetical protein
MQMIPRKFEEEIMNARSRRGPPDSGFVRQKKQLLRALSDHAESHDRKEIAPDQNVGPNSCRPSLQLGRNLV